jgi:hypothetical protein
MHKLHKMHKERGEKCDASHEVAMSCVASGPPAIFLVGIHAWTSKREYGETLQES